MGRHKIRNTKRGWKDRAERLSVDLARSEEARLKLMDARNTLLEQVRTLSGQLYRLQTELGTEAPTVSVRLTASPGPVYLLKPPQTGEIPLQGPHGERLAVPVHGTVSRPSQGRSRTHRPSWATG